MIHPDHAPYHHFTGAKRIAKAMNSLEGIVQGLAIDRAVSSKELSALALWLGQHREFIHLHPFTEVFLRVDEILSDGIVDPEEVADILWLCNRFTVPNEHFDVVTAGMQKLQGILGGIVADGIIAPDELRGLQDWMDENDCLRSCWPYDELEAIIMAVLKDGVIDANEHRALEGFFSEFFVHFGHRALELADPPESPLIMGVCAVSPNISFRERQFCFTGASNRITRAKIEEQVLKLGGIFQPRVTRETHYLVIGAAGNPCWTYACYGRKVEQAVQLRKKGSPLLIVHENDYWDAVQDHE